MKKCSDVWQELSKNKKEAIAENAKNYPILTAVLSNCLWSGIHIFGFDGLSVLLSQVTAQDAEIALNFAFAGYSQPKPAEPSETAEKSAEKAAEVETPKPAEKPASAAPKPAEQSAQKASGRPRKNPAPAAVPAENADFDKMSPRELKEFCEAHSCYHKVLQDKGGRKAEQMREWLKEHFAQKSAEAEAKSAEPSEAAGKPAEKEAEKPAEQPKPAEVQTAEADPYKGLDAKALYVLCLQRKIKNVQPRQDAAAYRALLEANDAEIEAAAKEEEKAEAEAQEAAEAAPAEQASYEPDAVPVPSEGEEFDDWDLADDDPTKAAEPAPAEAAEDDDDDWDL